MRVVCENVVVWLCHCEMIRSFVSESVLARVCVCVCVSFGFVCVFMCECVLARVCVCAERQRESVRLSRCLRKDTERKFVHQVTSFFRSTRLHLNINSLATSEGSIAMSTSRLIFNLFGEKK